MEGPARPGVPGGGTAAAAAAAALFLLGLVILPPPVTPAAAGAAAAAGPELCVVRTLDPRIVEPWLSVPRRALGCSSHGSLGPGGVEVHVVRLQQPQQPGADEGWVQEDSLPILELVLNATPHNASAAPLALLLDTYRPVIWRVTANGVRHDLKHFITICEECQLEEEPALRGATVQRRDWASRRALLRHVNKTWHALTSFTELHGANRLELKVGYGVAGEESGECNTSSRQQSPVAAASLKVPQPTQGCLNEDSIGHNARDVYVVEVQGRGPGAGAVQVLLQGEGPRPVPRNLTLVLKSGKPARWQLSSRGIDGSIVVVSDQQVENAGADAVVRSRRLPDGLDELLLSVFAEFGRPVLYAKTERASGLRLLVPTRVFEEERLSGDMAGEDESDTPTTVRLHRVMPHAALPGANFFRGLLNAQESHARQLGELRRAMRVICEPKRMNVSFPVSLLTRLGVAKLTLNDPSCSARYNATHAWLSSHVTSCGSLSASSSDGATIYTNSVHIRFSSPAPSDDEDEEASGAFEAEDPHKLAMRCKYFAQLGGMVVAEDGANGIDPDSLEGTPSPVARGGNIYQMELYRDPEHTQRVTPAHPTVHNPAPIYFDEVLFARTWIEGVTRSVQVVIDSCWMSNSSHPEYELLRVHLVRNTCPTVDFVRVTDPSIPGTRAEHGGFSFQVNKAAMQMGLLYLHCKLGLCTTDPVHTRGNLVLCVSQAQQCFRGVLQLDQISVPTAQQIVSRGPLQPSLGSRVRPSPVVPQLPVVTRPPPGLVHVHATPPATPPTAATPAPAAPEATSVVQGISTEMAAGIAVLSFAIGVSLTASMWCIQVKTDPMRQRRSKELIQQQQRAAAAAAAVGSSGGAPQAGSAAI